jgi:hypothetical protein
MVGVSMIEHQLQEVFCLDDDDDDDVCSSSKQRQCFVLGYDGVGQPEPLSLAV